MDNEWKSDLAFMLPFTAFAVVMGVAFTMTVYMNGNVEIERLRGTRLRVVCESVGVGCGIQKDRK